MLQCRICGLNFVFVKNQQEIYYIAEETSVKHNTTDTKCKNESLQFIPRIQKIYPYPASFPDHP